MYRILGENASGDVQVFVLITFVSDTMYWVRSKTSPSSKLRALNTCAVLCTVFVPTMLGSNGILRTGMCGDAGHPQYTSTRCKANERHISVSAVSSSQFAGLLTPSPERTRSTQQTDVIRKNNREGRAHWLLLLPPLMVSSKAPQEFVGVLRSSGHDGRKGRER